MTIETKSFGGGGLVQLAPDLSYVSNNLTSSIPYQSLSIDASGGLTTALSLTGKYAVIALGFSGLTAESVTVELTVDGVVIINDTFTSATAISILNCGNLGQPTGTTLIYKDIPYIQCESSLLLRIQTATDTGILFNYIARPIL